MNICSLESLQAFVTLQIISPFPLVVLQKWAVEKRSRQRFGEGAQHTKGRLTASLKQGEKCISMILHSLTEGN